MRVHSSRSLSSPSSPSSPSIYPASWDSPYTFSFFSFLGLASSPFLLLFFFFFSSLSPDFYFFFFFSSLSPDFSFFFFFSLEPALSPVFSFFFFFFEAAASLAALSPLSSFSFVWTGIADSEVVAMLSSSDVSRYCELSGAVGLKKGANTLSWFTG